MFVKVLAESGFEWAKLGTSLSRLQPVENMEKVCSNLADKDSGHNKFLEFISIWIDIKAPRYFWQQMATYRIGNSWLSESTMYNVTKSFLTQNDFEEPIFYSNLEQLNMAIRYYKDSSDREEKLRLFNFIKNNLPEGYLQRRIMVSNYKSLRNMYQQRIKHKLPQWQYFLNTIMNEIEYPEFIVKDYKNE